MTTTDQLYKKVGTRYKPTTLSEQRAWGWRDLMALSAFRYCLGRQTYIVGECANWLIEQWPNFSCVAKAFIQRELEEGFEQDDKDRAEGDQFKALGWDCDRAEWERVRALWSKEPAPKPYQPSPKEIAYRARLLVREMESMSAALLHTMPEAGRGVQDAANALKKALEKQT